MTVRSIVLSALLAALALAPAQSNIQTVDLRDGAVGVIDWSSSGGVRAEGLGCPGSQASSEAQRELTARRAAILVGQRRLLELIQGMAIYGGLELGDAMHVSEVVRASAEGVLRGATVVHGSERDVDGRCVALTMEVSMVELRRAVPQVPDLTIGGNSPPVAFDDRFVVVRGAAVALNIHANDVDLDGDQLEATVLTAPMHGTLAFDPDGSITYRHGGSDETFDRFSYRASDGLTASLHAVVEISIEEPARSALEDAERDVSNAGDVEDGKEPTGARSRGPNEAAVERFHETILDALRHEPVASPDQDLWRIALSTGEEAIEAHPENLELLLLMARALSYVGWHSRAWDHWNAYLMEAKDLSDPPRMADDELSSARLFVDSGTALAFAHYEQGRPDEALELFTQVLDWFPDSVESLAWSARIHFEAGRSTEALPLWERVARLEPADTGAAYFLARTKERLTFGNEASDSFQEGLLVYEQGRIDASLALFEEAARHESFIQAAVWAGRSSFELGLPDRALRHWERVVSLDPADERAAYFARLSEAQVQWGIPAANAFHSGEQMYAAGDFSRAAERFVAATHFNSSYLLAWEWAARSYEAMGSAEEALVYWQGLLQRDPTHELALASVDAAQRRVGAASGAGEALSDAIAAYQTSDFAATREHLDRALGADPQFAAAWAWLGRLDFIHANYSDAAESYQEAFRLEPSNDDYRYFSEEARRLAARSS